MAQSPWTPEILANPEQMLEMIVIHLLQNKGVFYASLISQMHRIQTDKMPTCGVTIQNGRIQLYWNPKCFEKCNLKEARALLEHECMHLVMDHMDRAHEREQKMWNIATDLAINQLIDELPKWVVTLDKFPPDWKMPVKTNAEVYYELLNKNSNKMEVSECDGKQCKKGSCGNGQGQGQQPQWKPGQGQPQGGGSGQPQPGSGQPQPGSGSGNQPDPNGQPQPGQGQGQDHNHKQHVKIKDKNGNVVSEFDVQSTDCHDKWKESDTPDLAKEVVKQAVKKALDEAVRDQGRAPAGLEEYIEELLKPPVIPWQSLLKKFVAMSVKAGKNSSWKRCSRRYGEMQKGHIPARKLKLTIAIDTSGSISEADFQAFICEIQGIMRTYKSDVTMLECDAQVQKKYILTPFMKVQTNFKGRGGTDFCPVFTYIQEKRIKTDALIYFTDLCGSFPERAPLYPTLWVSVTENERAPFGIVLSIPNHTAKKN